MGIVKKCVHLVIIAGFAVAALPSCKSNSNQQLLAPPPPIAFSPPDVKPLKLEKPHKIDWAAMQALPIKPAVEKFDFNKLPIHSYDSVAEKPFSKDDTITPFNYNATREEKWDTTKAVSKPLTFKTFVLPPPKIIRAAMPHLKTKGGLSIYDIGEELGQPNLVVSSFLTDRDGFLWIGTTQGLYRYDGENLYLFIPGPLDYNIFQMRQDSIGRIWFGAFNNNSVLQILDPHGGTLTKIGKAQGLSSNKVTDIYIDKQQKVWVTQGATAALNIIDLKAQRVKWLGGKTTRDTAGGGILRDKDDKLWVATSAGVHIIDAKKNTIKYLDKAHYAALDTPLWIRRDRAGNIWMTTKNGVIKVLNAQKNAIQTINEDKLPGNFIFNLAEDDKGQMWISSQQGALVVNLKNKTTYSLTKANGLNFSLAVATLQDRYGQEWIGTPSGLNVIGHNDIAKEKIGTTPTGTLFEDGRGLVWQASYIADIDILDRKAKTARHLTRKEGLSNDSIQNIKQVDGKIYICSNGGLDVFDTIGHTVSHFTNKQGLHSKTINSLVVDKLGRIWLGGTQEGIDIYDTTAHTINHIGKTKGLIDNTVADMAIDKRGNIWVSTTSGIAYISADFGSINYLKDVIDLTDRNTKLFMADDMGNMWIGTRHGIYIVDTKERTISHITEAQGLVNQQIASLLQRNHRIYAGTFKGISIFTPPPAGVPVKEAWSVQSFGKNYGIYKTNLITYLTDMISRDGYYWWGDVGATLFDLSKKDTLQTEPFVAGIRVMDKAETFVNHSLFEIKKKDTLWGQGDTHFVKGEQLVNIGYLTPNDKSNIKWDEVEGPFNMPVNLHLPHNQNFLQFYFSSLNLVKRDSAFYRYFLTSVDEQWSDPTPYPITRSYYNLKPGKYTIEVSAKNPNGTWSRPAVFDFTINPPWWQTWWACLIYIIVLGGVIYAFVYYRSLQLVKEKRILEHKVHLRTEEVMQQKEELEAQRDELEQAFGELKLTQSQLVQSEKLASLGELTAGIAHEIQNPLNFVNNFAEVSVELLAELKEEQARDERDPALENEIIESLEQNLEKISMHGKRAAGIVKNMLQHSRSNSGERELTDLATLADEYFRLSYHGLRAKDKTFNSAMETQLDAGLPKLNIVPQDIGRVLLNLFNNAFYAVYQKKKENPEGYQPTVTLKATSHKRSVEIRVRDNGNGIPENIRGKIMQPFFTTKPTGEGTGLGLSLSYDIIVKGHGGTINIDTKEGEYTEFIISLPV